VDNCSNGTPDTHSDDFEGQCALFEIHTGGGRVSFSPRPAEMIATPGSAAEPVDDCRLVFDQLPSEKVGAAASAVLEPLSRRSQQLLRELGCPPALLERWTREGSSRH
jgi:hypothetical protein